MVAGNILFQNPAEYLDKPSICFQKEADRLRLERSKNQEEKLKLSLVEQELSEVRLALAKAEIEMNSTKLRKPAALQEWLKITYQHEAKYFQYRKQLALNQMQDAKEAVSFILLFFSSSFPYT